MPTDPVCGMYVPDTSEITATQDARVYYFCSTTCRVKFQKPEEEKKREKVALTIAWGFTIPILLINYLLTYGYKDYLMLALAIPVQFYSGLLFYRGAYQSLKMRSGNMDLLISIGTLTAFFFSLYITLFPASIPGSSAYFDASASIIAIILTGNYIQSLTEVRANAAANKLIERIPQRVHRVDDKGNVEDVKTDTLKEGDVILIKPGEVLPVDGTVSDGTTEIDESMLTGEAEPVMKLNGSRVTSGTINLNGAIRVRVDRTGKDTTISKMYILIKQAASGRLKIQKLADRFSAYFVPVVIAAAVVSAVVWFLYLSSIGSGMVYEITILSLVSVVIIACPCAIGLATPITLLISSNVSSSRSILLKNMSALDRLSKVNLVVLDKTGTLTESTPKVESMNIKQAAYNDLLLTYAASLEGYSNHPIARAITSYARDKQVRILQATDVEEKPGSGIRGVIEGKQVEVRRGAGRNSVEVYIGGVSAGDMVLSYGLKTDADKVVRRFESIGIKTAMVTGDRKEEAERIGKILGIDDIHYEITPEKKAEIIREYQNRGLFVMYAGDGINDAIAIETADFGVAMAGGSDIAKESGDAVLLKDDLMLLYDIRVIASSTISKVKQNIIWAVGYNTVLIPIAGGVLVPLLGLGIYSFLPMLSAAAMGMSSVSVVLNSLTLRSSVKRKLNRISG